MTVSIIISEKGGAERREGYDQPEVSIGRVKGNDILLPKGNVSKRHARLIFRDGRCIVTDLKSTNGTYVNHRRITHATLVREGDRIYIGDFVLRIEGEANVGKEEASRTTLGGLDVPSEPSFSSRMSRGPLVPVASAPPMSPEVVSHFPIEHDPDESSPMLEVPGPPRVPAGLRPSSTGSVPVQADSPSSPELFPASEPPATPSHASSSMQPSDADRLAALQRRLAELVASVEAALTAPPPLLPEQAFDAEVTRTIDAELARLGPEATAELDLPALRDAARRELVELGPLGPLLDDANIAEIQVLGGELSIVRRGRRQAHKGLSFTRDRALSRAIERLAARAGIELDPNEPCIDVLLPNGVELSFVRPPASPMEHHVSLRKALRCEGTLNGLVRSGAISRGMATLLAHCSSARANVLVTSAHGAGSEEVVGALADAADGAGRVMWLLDGRQLPPSGSASIEMGRSAGERLRALRTACRFAPAHLVAPALGAAEVAVVVDAVAEGLEGLILRSSAPTLRQAVARMSADLASQSTGGNTEAARERLLSAFDIVIEVARLRDGRLRVLRLAELRAGVAGGLNITDLFSFSYHRTAAGGSIEGSFVASGAIPAIVEELAARGMPLDTSIFRRHPSG